MSTVAVRDQKEFDDAAKVLSWNRWLLTFLGVWPKNPSRICFGIEFAYVCYLMSMEYLDLWLVINDLGGVIENLTENMALSQIFIRIAMLKRYNKSLGKVIDEVLRDYDSRKYKTTEESDAFIGYNKKSKLFVKLLSAFVVLTASSYFVKPLTAKPPEDLATVLSDNASVAYELPYRFHIFYKIEDDQTYLYTYLSQLPFLLISGCGQSAADCLMVTLVFHVCGQMASLAERISKIRSDSDFCDEQLRDIVKDHNRLLRMGTTVQQAFSETLLGHLIGATSLVCIVGYQCLSNFAKGQNAELGTFVLFVSLVLLVLYSHCTVGESLITESLNVHTAFYNCDWYNMPTKNARVIIICMARSQKPLCLTAGKFGIFCLKTLTEALKTAMGYLSVLRTLL
ncbi:odorant receptor 85b-like [Venturia canescens]|uniref:odorant receptor 85b-like n=1 Tax=Venturia canescens TaxID=32260 RepID=UPI001C9CB6FC|nr:odorant receptor 85b-like [Venturia canescens]